MGTKGLEGIIRKLVGTEGILKDIMSGRKYITSLLAPLLKLDMGQTVEISLSDILSKVCLRALC